MRKWLVVLLLVPGCAFALSGPDPDRPRNQPPRCDTTKGLVVVDGLMATTMGIAALSLTATDEPAVALIPAAIGALFVGGAVRGNNNVNACRAAMDGYAMAMNHGPLPDVSQDPPSPIASAPMEPAVNPQPAIGRPVAPPPAQPVQPAAVPPVAQQPARAPTTKGPPRGDDEWGEFWKEVP
jgi:hypothetical protein